MMVCLASITVWDSDQFGLSWWYSLYVMVISLALVDGT